MFIRFCIFWKNYKLFAADLSKQKALDADPKAIQQITLTGQVDEQSKETKLEFAKGTTKVL